MRLAYKDIARQRNAIVQRVADRRAGASPLRLELVQVLRAVLQKLLGQIQYQRGGVRIVQRQFHCGPPLHRLVRQHDKIMPCPQRLLHRLKRLEDRLGHLDALRARDFKRVAQGFPIDAQLMHIDRRLVRWRRGYARDPVRHLREAVESFVQRVRQQRSDSPLVLFQPMPDRPPPVERIEQLVRLFALLAIDLPRLAPNLLELPDDPLDRGFQLHRRGVFPQMIDHHVQIAQRT